MKRISLLIATILLVANAAIAQDTRYNFDKNADFSKFKTYKWVALKDAAKPNELIDKQIVAAVDRELASVGLKPVATGTPDVFVTYYSVSRTDVDVKAKPDEKGLRPEHTVGSLVVAMLDPASRKPVLQLRVDRPVDRADIEGSVNTLVGELFTKYPTRDGKKQ